ncbi:DUF2798 domain-containing protein [Mesorhizobium sp. ANAO-SY3R2]|uniref:DUF2798 domain-containing protein n=1 Tax=Mesorhizobium sp. ANAO-SY3R2 TaxID=3166644 RepID=UPI00366C4773
MHTLKTILLAQAMISFAMALMMTGFFAFLALGPTSEWLHAWARSFVIAWPVAFCLSLVVGKVAFKIAAALTVGRTS